MAGGSNTMGVRTKLDKAEEEHERRMMELVEKGNRNPFQQFFDPILNSAAHVYDTYLYSAGVLFIGMSFWAFYPSFVRFRHQRIFRYRRTQLTFRRGLFGTPHIPKWDKKYLQRIVVPPLPAPPIAVETVAAQAVAPPAAVSAHLGDGTTPGAVAVVQTPEAMLTTQESDAAVLYKATDVQSRRSAHSRFNNDDADKSERALSRELLQINKDFFGPKSDLFERAIRADAEDLDLQSRLKAAVASAKAVVVLKEDHSAVRSIPEGWEVWWVSFPEAKRRRFCKFWLGALLIARAFEDLMDMPDMPDLVN